MKKHVSLTSIVKLKSAARNRRDVSYILTVQTFRRVVPLIMFFISILECLRFSYLMKILKILTGTHKRLNKMFT